MESVMGIIRPLSFRISYSRTFSHLVTLVGWAVMDLLGIVVVYNIMPCGEWPENYARVSLRRFNVPCPMFVRNSSSVGH